MGVCSLLLQMALFLCEVEYMSSCVTAGATKTYLGFIIGIPLLLLAYLLTYSLTHSLVFLNTFF